jgi:hypothetical protein
MAIQPPEPRHPPVSPPWLLAAGGGTLRYTLTRTHETAAEPGAASAVLPRRREARAGARDESGQYVPSR